MTNGSKNWLPWGIIRYAPGSGATPEADAAAFDGWYRSRQDALEVARMWHAEYPDWVIALIRNELVWSDDKDFGRVSRHPLTQREMKAFKAGRDGTWPNTFECEFVPGKEGKNLI